jgi:anaerobic C4-dicarboxylate transporter
VHALVKITLFSKVMLALFKYHYSLIKLKNNNFYQKNIYNTKTKKKFSKKRKKKNKEKNINKTKKIKLIF